MLNKRRNKRSHHISESEQICRETSARLDFYHVGNVSSRVLSRASLPHVTDDFHLITN